MSRVFPLSKAGELTLISSFEPRISVASCLGVSCSASAAFFGGLVLAVMPEFSDLCIVVGDAIDRAVSIVAKQQKAKRKNSKHLARGRTLNDSGRESGRGRAARSRRGALAAAGDRHRLHGDARQSAIWLDALRPSHR
jgi:hypothetical protein